MACISVTQINKLIKQDIENDLFLRSVQVMGEVSNFKGHSSGHLYFTLKDNDSRINCVMFSSYTNNLKFNLDNGMKVIVTCSVGVYVSSGSYQLYVYNIEPIGIGNLFLQFEKLKETLNNEGLFDISNKKQIPKYPTNIGVISAKEGAAIHDVITTIIRRWPIAKITLLPSLVQGQSAVNDILSNLDLAESLNFDLIIVARGGGSIEDLWCFNDELVARKVFNMKTPIISAIGHEVDFTIIDFVADYRAPTPTGAGEIATPNILEVVSNLNTNKQRIITAFKKIIDTNLVKLNNLRSSPYLTRIENIFGDKQAKLNLLEQKLLNSKNKFILSNEVKLKSLESKLDALSPLKIMSRGYGIITSNDNVVTSVKDIKVNDTIKTSLKDGEILSKVIEIKEK